MVSVVGNDFDNVDGLATALESTHKAHRENAVQIINLHEAAEARKRGERGPKKTDPRPAYVYRPFPKHTYHADGRELVCADPAALEAAQAMGFRTESYPVVRVAVGDPRAEKAALELKLRESDGKLATQNELLLKMGERLEALEAAAASGDADPEPAKRKR